MLDLYRILPESLASQEFLMSTSHTANRPRTTNILLACNAALLGIIAVSLLGQRGLTSTAIAQDSGRVGVVGNTKSEDDSPTAYVSAVEQRKTMISELRTITGRLERIESALSRGINVKVTSMPASREDRGDKDAK
jgi:hypothetical protein